MRARLVVVFVLSLLPFLAINMPVQQLFRFIQPPPQLLLSGIEGSLLGGRIRQIEYRGLAFENLSYRLLPGCLFRLALCYRLEDADGDLHLRVSVSPFSGVGLENSRLTLTMRQLGAMTSALLVKPTGELELQLDDAVLARDGLGDLQGVIYWKQAGIEGENLSLGDFRADIARTEQGVELRFADMPGARIGVAGSLQLDARRYRLDLKLEARPELAESARNALELLARKTGLNRYRIQRQGVLPQPLPLLAGGDDR